MERIKQILLDKGKAVADSAIEAKLNEYGIEGDVSDADAKAIAEELEPQAQSVGNGLAVSNGNGKASAPAKSKGKGGRRKQTPTLTDALTHTASVAQAELNSVNEVVKAGAEAWANDQADQLVSTIRNAPKEALEKFAAMALEESADINSFRQVGQEISSILFAVQQPTQAE